MIVAIVLAAGESSRMGSPKALLPIGGKLFIERIVSGLEQTQVGKIVIVLGHNAEEIKPKVSHLPVTVVVNRDYEKGQLSSLIVAIRSLEAEMVDGILVHLVDHPLLNPSLVDRMIALFYESKKSIVVPIYSGRRGHPVIFSSRLFPDLLQAPLDVGAKSVVNAHRDETLEIETDDQGVIVDIDTPEEYHRHIREE
jgi:molybdenum cofactor cytidylyltransferase